MCLISEMLQKTFDNGVKAASTARAMGVPANQVLNPYMHYGKGSRDAWRNGFDHKWSESNPG